MKRIIIITLLILAAILSGIAADEADMNDERHEVEVQDTSIENFYPEDSESLESGEVGQQLDADMDIERHKRGGRKSESSEFDSELEELTSEMDDTVGKITGTEKDKEAGPPDGGRKDQGGETNVEAHKGPSWKGQLAAAG
eukprot:GHVU01105442.1.p2 GENE.GHVU01105442.1~~GHVU01105442.1.p2  ORF type:complete len:141 (+),score=21.22 GHVU01105442.1:260-682(+)